VLNVSLQKVIEQDLEFLFKVYASTRAEEVAQTGWPAQQQHDFLQMQFTAQHTHYQQHYPEATFDLIMLGDQVVGRLYVSRWPTQIRIVDIALLSEFRGKKIGELLMRKLFAEAKEKQLEISLHVKKNNPAMQWYLKLGFKKIEDKGVYSLMKTQFFAKQNTKEKNVETTASQRKNKVVRLMQNHRSKDQNSQPTEKSTVFIDDKLQAGILNQLLRQQLSPSKPVQSSELTVSETAQTQPQTLLSTAVAAVTEILSRRALTRADLHNKLSALFYQQKSVYDAADIDPRLRKRQFITHCGLIMSPDNCMTTQLDDLRVRAFIRGIHQALADKIVSQPGPLHIVYPACGPFAPLLMPLIGYYKAQHQYSPQQLQITFIDMQPGAIESLQALVAAMDIEAYIKDIICGDAMAYQPDNASVDMVILEAMQHGFSREGQFSIARHFAGLLAPEGCFIPQKVSVRAALNVAQREFVEQWQKRERISEQDMDLTVKAERTELGEILSVTAQSLRNLPERVLDENTTLIECGKVTIPPMPNKADEQTLILCATVNTYGDETIGEYDSGITHPLPDLQVCINFKPRDDRPGDLLLNSGDGIQFFYHLNGLPGFLATWCEGDTSHG